jgi:hypothetical protein
MNKPSTQKISSNQPWWEIIYSGLLVVKVSVFGLRFLPDLGEMGEIRNFGRISENSGRKAQTKI